MTGRSLSLLFPCFNEGANLPHLLRECSAFVPTYPGPVEILIVDDGSTDETPRILPDLQIAQPALRWVRHPVNRGYGAAVRTGFGEARHELVFYSDGDGQFGLGSLPSFLDEMNRGWDGVVGYRERRRDSLLRRAEGWAWNRLVSLLLDIRFRDVDCAYKLLRREAIEPLVLRSAGAAISPELLVRLLGRGAKLRELPVPHYPRLRGSATGGNPRVIVRALRELLSLWLELRQVTRSKGGP